MKAFLRLEKNEAVGAGSKNPHPQRARKLRRMTAFLRLEKNEAVHLRAHYEGVAYETLRILWARRSLIATVLAADLVLSCLALVLIGPRYTGDEALIQLNFIREEPATGAKNLPMATVDAAAVVDGAARIIRSRATACAVVTRLGLDKDPTFARQSLSSRVLTSMRSTFGLAQAMPSNYDLAVNQLMRRVTVTNDPRSYLISVSITLSDRERAASLANAVALEYLRGQLLQQVAEAYAAAERELADLSSIYGALHPSYLNGQAKLERLQVRLNDLRDGMLSEDALRHVIGQSFVAAEKVSVPTDPNIILILGLSAAAALAAGIWLALLLRPVRSNGVAAVGEKPR
jgi:uncharacterized protein involved in exopolysaccharide biosynthesis